MPAKLLGAHVPTAGGLGNAIRKGHAMGCTAVQVFTSSPQQWKGRVITQELAADFKAACRDTGISSIVSHDSYLIRLSSVDQELRAKSYFALKAEIERCHALGIKYVVSHMGSYNNQTLEESQNRLAETTMALLHETPDDVMLLMETTAGQGHSLNSRFEELARVLELCDGDERLGVCLDTCHVFVAGYDIRTDEGYNRTFEEFDRLIGLDRLKAIHCNDSKKGLGSRVDRHEHIGVGEIGRRAFELLVNDPRFENIPMLLETDSDDNGHERDLATLKGLIASEAITS